MKNPGEMKRIPIVSAWLVAVFAVLLSPQGYAQAQATSTGSGQAYPAKPVRIIVPLPVGNPPDFVARIIGQHLTGAFGQQVIVDNRPGAGGTIGAAMAAK